MKPAHFFELFFARHFFARVACRGLLLHLTHHFFEHRGVFSVALHGAWGRDSRSPWRWAVAVVFRFFV